MKRVISSKDTFFYKIILPVFFLICGAIVPTAIYFYDRNSNSVAAGFVFLFLFVSAALLFVMTGKSKKVSVDNQSLYISNYLKEIAVPLSNIDRILWVGDVRPTMIFLKTNSAFGKQINFYPSVKAASSESNPIVEELKKMANIKDEESTNQTKILNN